MLVFGIDVPLIEIVFAITIIIIILLVESLVVIMLLIKQMAKTKKVGEAVEKLSEAILQVKRAEIEELDKLSRR